MGFKIGDRVKVIESEEDDLGFVDIISAIDEDGLICVGDEDAEYPRGCWHLAHELTPIAPAAADADTSDFYSEFERGWDGATQSMLDIIERAIANPAGGDALKNIAILLENFRKTYPKHGVRQATESEGGRE